MVSFEEFKEMMLFLACQAEKKINLPYEELLQIWYVQYLHRNKGVH